MNKITEVPSRPTAPGYSDKEFLHRPTAAVVLPLLQSLITGIVVMILSLIVLLTLDVLDVFVPSLMIGAIVFVAAWFFLQGRWLKLTDLEKLFNYDFNQDHVIGDKPSARSIRVQIDRVKENGHIEQSQMFDFTGYATEEQLITFARGMTHEGKTMAVREWSGAGKPFSKDGWSSFRSELLRRRLARPINKKSSSDGFELTPDGEEVFKQIADADHE